MSKKTLYQMFKGKEDLFEALICDVEEHDSVSAAFLDDAATPEKLLATALLGIVTWVLSPRQIGLTRLVIAESPHIENLGMRFRQNGIEKGRKILCERLKVIHEIHGIRVHDFDETANVLFGAALGNLQLRALTGEDIGLERDERHLTQRIDKIVQMTIAYMKLT
ncbi:hypothetical protein Pav013_1412 [Pseudomonas syringae pv. avellanae str. ISPaVe013]|nr:hypothetical protein Pav013_1412 [Pseudomonas syringae pv. avellanae str. ISPaVe013]